jgi:ABC-type sugar transport system substrate-binding protein
MTSENLSRFSTVKCVSRQVENNAEFLDALTMLSGAKLRVWRRVAARAAATLCAAGLLALPAAASAHKPHEPGAVELSALGHFYVGAREVTVTGAPKRHRIERQAEIISSLSYQQLSKEPDDDMAEKIAKKVAAIMLRAE